MDTQHQLFEIELTERQLNVLLKLKHTAPKQWEAFAQHWLEQHQIHDCLTQQAKPIASYSKSLDDESFFTRLQLRLDQLPKESNVSAQASKSSWLLVSWLKSLTQPFRLASVAFALLILTVSVYFLIPQPSNDFDGSLLVQSHERKNQNINFGAYRQAMDDYQIDEYFLAHAMATGYPQSTIRAVSFNPNEGR